MAGDVERGCFTPEPLSYACYDIVIDNIHVAHLLWSSKSGATRVRVCTADCDSYSIPFTCHSTHLDYLSVCCIKRSASAV